MEARQLLARVASPESEPACKTTRDGGDHKPSFHQRTEPITMHSGIGQDGSMMRRSSQATKDTENGKASRFSTGPVAVRNAVQSGVCNCEWRDGSPATRAIQLSALKDVVERPDGADVSLWS